MTRPRSSVPIWASDDTYAAPNEFEGEDTKLEPSAGELSQGYKYKGRPAAPKYNWVHNMYSRFIEYNDGRLSRIPLYNIKSITANDNDSSNSNYAIVYSKLSSRPRWFVYCHRGDFSNSVFRSNTRFNWTGLVGDGDFAQDAASSTTRIVIAEGANNDGLSWSSNGQDFTPSTVNGSGGQYSCVFWTGTNFIASASGGSMKISSDGGTFDNPTTPAVNWALSAYGAAQFAMSPDTGRVIGVPTSGSRFIYSDDDGDSWSEVNVDNATWRGVTYKHGIWYAVKSTTGNAVYSSSNNGLTWTQLVTPGMADVFMRKLFTHENYIVGLAGDTIWFSEDGENWERGIYLNQDGLETRQAWHLADGQICVACHNTSSGVTNQLVLTQQVF